MARIPAFSALSVAALLAAAPAIAAPEGADPSLVEKGRYLATAGDCTSCHNNPKTGNPFSGGYGVGSPIGMIYGPNITPSAKTGIGSWTLDEFSNAVRKGRGRGGHYLYPAMPYTAFSGISDADTRALYSYFMLGVPAAENEAPKTELAFPFNIRPLMMGWDLLFGASGGKPAAQAPESGVARGKYLVDTLAHCSTCHTPRGMLMEEKTGSFLAGAQLGQWKAPNITSDPVSGIGKWSEDDLFRYLKTGYVDGKGVAAGEMGLAVQNSFSKLTDGDIRSIAAYIKTVPPVNTGAKEPRSGWSKSAPLPVDKLESPLEQKDYKAFITVSNMSGAQIYEGACATCHGYDGRGTPDRVMPSLVGSSAVGSADPANLVMTITDGVSRTVHGNHVLMPVFKTKLNTSEIAKVADYVATAFGDPSHRVTEGDVQRVYGGGREVSWLIANAAALTWAGLAVVVMAIIGLFVAWRRKA
ncbi:MAG: c-type cytochrome [Proteobacteria bacterium]|nr:c-type cytochrome [Pseudomonadota bacterium]